jgi:hypothetical protein
VPAAAIGSKKPKKPKASKRSDVPRECRKAPGQLVRFTAARDIVGTVSAVDQADGSLTVEVEDMRKGRLFTKTAVAPELVDLVGFHTIRMSSCSKCGSEQPKATAFSAEELAVAEEARVCRRCEVVSDMSTTALL